MSRRTIGWGLVFACLLGTLVLGAASKLPCAADGLANGRKYQLLCYTDIVPLVRTEQLSGGRLPYLDACAPTHPYVQCDEYPVLTMYFMRAAAWMSGTSSGSRFLVVNEWLLGGCAVGIALMLHRLGGKRALFFALAPALITYAFLNWDLFATLFAVAGLYAFLRRRDGWAGVWLGLGAAAKLYPALFVVPLAADRVRARSPRRAAAIAVGAAGSWAIVNVPFAIAATKSWDHFFRVSRTRKADFASLWGMLCHFLPSDCLRVRWIDAYSLLLLAGLFALVWWRKTVRHPDFARWTLVFPILVLFLLTSKLYSPQYGIWLLPLFALALPDVRAFAAFSVADLFVYVATFKYLGSRAGFSSGWPRGALEAAVLVRAAVLIWCLFLWMRREPEPPAGEEVPVPRRAGAATPGTAIA